MIAPRSRSPFEGGAAAWPPAARFGAALSLVLATTALIALATRGWGHFTIESPGTIYAATITLAAVFLGLGPALVALGASIIAVYLLFTVHESLPRMIVLAATVLVIIGLAEWQRRARDAGARAQAKLAAILESMNDAVMVVDRAGRATDVNHAAITMLGASDHADALAKMMRRRDDGTPYTDEYGLLERALAGGEIPQNDVLIPNEPDAPRTVSAVASPIRDARGQVIGAVSVSRDMTERLAQARERERLLRQVEEEQRFTRNVLATVPVGIAVVRADDFTVLSFNGEYDASIRSVPGGRPLRVGQSLLDAMPPASHDAATRLLSRARDERTMIRSTAYAATVAPDRFYDGTIQLLHLGDGTEALLITAVNVTERVQGAQEREALLQRVERQAAQLEATFEAMVDGVAVYDAEGNVLQRNGAFYRLLHLEPGVAAPIWEAFIRDMHLRRADGAPMTREETHSFRALQGETVREEVVLVRDGLGRDRSMSQNAAPIRAADGSVIGAVVVFNDVTERLEQEREREALLALIEERRRFTQAIFDTVPVTLAVVDTDALTFRIANPAFLDAVPEPYRSEGVNGRPLTIVLPHTRENGFAEQLQTVGATGEPFGASGTRYEHPARGVTYWNEMMIPLVTSDPGAHHVLYIAADVTEEVVARQRIAALAREAAERANQLEAVFGALTEGLILTDVDGAAIRSNAALARILGLDGEPVPPLDTFRARFNLRDEAGDVIPQERYIAPAALGGATATGQLRRFRDARGEERWMSVSASPVRDETGAITGAAMTMRDVTEERQGTLERERLLREVEERRRFVQTVIESAPAGIAVFAADTDATVRIANDRYLQSLDEPWQSEGIVGRGVRDFVARAAADTLLALVRQVVESRQSVFLREYAQAGLSGEAVYVDLSLVPLVESGDQVTGVLSLVADVTERVQSRRRIEELARDAAQRASELETVIASIADGVMVTDAVGRIIMENDASRRLMGRTRSAVSFDLTAQVEAQGLRDPDGIPILPDALPLGRAVRGETVTDQVLIVRRADTGADRFLMCSSAPVRAGGGAITGAVAVFRDITEMKQLDQMKDEFISIAAHELRTPLTAIKGYAELLDRRLTLQGGRESDRKSLAVIRKQTDRLSGLVNEMLDTSRIEAGRLQLNSEPFDLATLVGEVMNNIRVSSETPVLTLTAEAGIEVFGDTARIEQVLINLISNAITYSPEGGEVGIRVWAAGGNGLVSVHDQGVGIAREEVAHIFDRFYRAPKAGVMRSGGMGLGLYISREIVSRHGGTIQVESVEGAGSTFTVTLPRAGQER